MSRIFISYRRADSIAITGRIHDRLVETFGAENIFKDVDNIPPGADFRTVVAREVGACDVLLVIIGQDWSVITNSDGRLRLYDPTDFVRIEVEAGLSRPDMLVVPVLTDYASMPLAKDLPESLQSLLFRNAVSVRHDPDFNRDATRLVQHLKQYFELQNTIKQDLHQLDNMPQSTSWSEIEASFSQIEEKSKDFETLMAKIRERHEYWRANYQERAEQIMTTAREQAQSQFPDKFNILSLIERARKLSPSKSVIDNQEYPILERLRVVEKQELEERQKAEQTTEKPKTESESPVVAVPNNQNLPSQAKLTTSYFAFAPNLNSETPDIESPPAAFPKLAIPKKGIIAAFVCVLVLATIFFRPPSSGSQIPTRSLPTETPTIEPSISAATAVARVAGQKTLVYGPVSGAVPEADPNSCRFADTANVNLSNLMVTVQIPSDDSAGIWERGIFFRDNESAPNTPHYRLIVKSTGEWFFILWRGQYYTLKTGRSKNVITSLYLTNSIRLIVYGNQAWFYLNGYFEDSLDISGHLDSGIVRLVTCLDGALAPRTSSMQFSNFEVFSLP